MKVARTGIERAPRVARRCPGLARRSPGRRVLAVVAIVACGPSSGVPTPDDTSTGTSSMLDPGSTAADDDGTSAAGVDSTSTGRPAGSSGSGSGSDTSSESGPVFEDCEPRELDDGVGWYAFLDGDPRLQFGDAAGPCTFVGSTGPTQPGTTELQLSCVLDAAPSSTVTIVLGFALEALPMTIDEPLELAAVREPEGAFNPQTLLTLRGAEGDLRLAAFAGYAPGGKKPETAGFFAPLQLALVGGLCPPPCPDPFGCPERAALDVSLPGFDPVRIFDGNLTEVGRDPAFAVRVQQADIGSLGIDDPGAHVDIVATRLSPS